MSSPRRGASPPTPLERVEGLYRELTLHYHEAQDAELRAAAKLLLVAVAELRRCGGPGWQQLIQEYVRIASEQPERFERIIQTNRSACSDSSAEETLQC